MEIKTAVESDATSNTTDAPDGKVSYVGWMGGCCNSDAVDERMWVAGS